MPKTTPFYTSSFAYPKDDTLVYHDRDDCPNAKRIEKHHRLEGDGGQPRCKECERLEAESEPKR
jgi:hypothetical protein